MSVVVAWLWVSPLWNVLVLRALDPLVASVSERVAKSEWGVDLHFQDFCDRFGRLMCAGAATTVLI